MTKLKIDKKFILLENVCDFGIALVTNNEEVELIEEGYS